MGRYFPLFAILASFLFPAEASSPIHWTVENDAFHKDGKQFQFFSGSFHYFRAQAEYWDDIFLRLRAMGLNTITTYVPWNYHQPEKNGPVDFSTGNKNLGGFLSLAEQHNFSVLLRLGPYVCGEWELGGFPAWLLGEPGMVLRSNNSVYINAITPWFKTLLEQVNPYLAVNGGPVAMVQIENEFGSYGNVYKNAGDREYMLYLYNMTRKSVGPNQLIYTTDGAGDDMKKGSLPGGDVVSTGDGGYGGNQEMNPKGKNPCMCSEDYPGWLSHWGDLSMKNSSGWLNRTTQIKKGCSFNMYMAYGGSNFYFEGGDGHDAGIEPCITSYDYSAPITEGRESHYKNGINAVERQAEVMQPFWPTPLPKAPPAPVRKAYGKITLTERVNLYDLLTSGSFFESKSTKNLTSMEVLGWSYGVITYCTTASVDGSFYSISDYISDYGYFMNGNVRQGAVIARQQGATNITVSVSKGDKVCIIVDNMGRINFSHSMFDPKGFVSDRVATIGTTPLSNYEAHFSPVLDYDALKSYPFKGSNDCSGIEKSGPAYLRGTFNSSADHDTYLTLPNFEKGYVWVNGNNIGRYFNRAGPQLSLYVPKTFLLSGQNDIIVLEFEGTSSCTLESVTDPVWGKKTV